MQFEKRVLPGCPGRLLRARGIFMVSGSPGFTQELHSPACLPGWSLAGSGGMLVRVNSAALVLREVWDSCLKCSRDAQGAGQSRREVCSEHFCDLLPVRD